jgi:hypothetical protein
MKTFKRVGVTFVNAVLLLGLVGLLIAYLVVVSDLPARVYTMDQREFLRYNYSRSVAQSAPTWNVVKADGAVVSTNLPGQDSRVRATLTARYEEEGGVSATVYDLDFRGEYRLRHTGPMSTTIELFFPFPGNLETLHEVRFEVDGEEPPGARYTTQGISWQTLLDVGEEHQIEISYQADGANSFSYGLHHNQRSDVDVVVTVVGLDGSEVSEASLPASAYEVTDEGEIWTWEYARLIADRNIQLSLPTRLSFAQRVAQLQDDFRTLAGLAPVLVGAFLASLAGVLYLGNVRLRLVTYLLTGCGLALFYPLLTFLSGMVDLMLAAALALAVVSGLLVTFVGLTAGWRRGAWRAALLLVVYLGLFSLGMLTPWQGLFLTGGGLLLVGTFMLLYARHRSAVQAEAEVETMEGPGVESLEAPPEFESEPEPQPEEESVQVAASADLHCPYCARSLDEDYQFCPSCGHDTSHVRRCQDCGRQQFVPIEMETVYCVHCGASIAGTPGLD